MKKKILSVLLGAVFAVQLQAFAANVTTGTVSDGSGNYTGNCGIYGNCDRKQRI